MKRLNISLLVLFAPGAIAFAQNAVSWVASSGSDANACTRPAPCRTFAAAIVATATDGAVYAVDAADYQPFTANKSITIDGAGTGVVVVGTSSTPNAVTVAVSGNSQVTLRNLNIYPYVISPTAPGNTLSYGVTTNNTGSPTLNIENVLVVSPIGAKTIGVGLIGTSSNQVHLRNVRISGGLTGVTMTGTGTSVPTLSAEHLAITNAGYGLVTQDCSFTVRDSIFHGNTNQGIVISAFALATSALIERSETSFNAVGLLVTGSSTGATARISDTVITGNGVGVATSGAGNDITFRTNMIANNGVDGVPVFTTSLK